MVNNDQYWAMIMKHDGTSIYQLQIVHSCSEPPVLRVTQGAPIQGEENDMQRSIL